MIIFILYRRLKVLKFFYFTYT